MFAIPAIIVIGFIALVGIVAFDIKFLKRQKACRDFDKMVENDRTIRERELKNRMQELRYV